MSKTKISRKEMLKKPDEFLSLTSKAIDFVRTHKQIFDYLGTAVLVLILLYMGFYAYMRHVNKKGQEEFNKAYYAMVNSSDGATDSKKTEELFGAVIEKYGMSKAADLALPELAYAKFEQKQYDEAIALYEEYLAKASEDGPYDTLARLAISTCYEQKGEYEKALEPLEVVMEGPDDSIKEQAMLNMARIYRLEGNRDKSNEVLKEFKEKFPKSDFLEMADSLISL